MRKATPLTLNSKLSTLLPANPQAAAHDWYAQLPMKRMSLKPVAHSASGLGIPGYLLPIMFNVRTAGCTLHEHLCCLTRAHAPSGAATQFAM
ncbi:hypothetical protein CBOM_08026 [Ceraceosorus bombacis]|uniref:Uncharacterized protein n=1 Tax=Ceraceosorus bombacis TaxID=401625 RepID=A0A0P1BQT8_9BASI|nr:hypothetical protein CBOM_08026 [Ceraceosorus bombacis]